MIEKTTEASSLYRDLDKMEVDDILRNINTEDFKVAESVKKVIPEIAKLIPEIVSRMQKGGRLFYIGAGTSGRLGIVDASECPPTFGIDHGMVIGLIAGGDTAIRKAVEFAEDDHSLGWKDLQSYNVNKLDTVVGIAASGTTPYVIGAIEEARKNGNLTACICCNSNSPLSQVSQYPIEVVVGPEFITGSTRMKAGTAQKLVLNMISTGVMIKLGRVRGNKMVDMQLSNNKLIERGIKMLMEELNIERLKAEQLLGEYGSVRKVLAAFKK